MSHDMALYFSLKDAKYLHSWKGSFVFSISASSLYLWKISHLHVEYVGVWPNISSHLLLLLLLHFASISIHELLPVSIHEVTDNIGLWADADLMFICPTLSIIKQKNAKNLLSHLQQQTLRKVLTRTTAISANELRCCNFFILKLCVSTSTECFYDANFSDDSNRLSWMWVGGDICVRNKYVEQSAGFFKHLS